MHLQLYLTIVISLPYSLEFVLLRLFVLCRSCWSCTKCWLQSWWTTTSKRFLWYHCSIYTCTDLTFKDNKLLCYLLIKSIKSQFIFCYTFLSIRIKMINLTHAKHCHICVAIDKKFLIVCVICYYPVLCYTGRDENQLVGKSSYPLANPCINTSLIMWKLIYIFKFLMNLKK